MFSNPCFFNDPFDAFPAFGPFAEKQMDYVAKREFAFLPPGVQENYHAYRAKIDERRPLVQLRAQTAYPVRYKRELGNTIGVMCLSEKHDNILMLSHYADSHRGVVVGFNPQRLGTLGDLMRVDYKKRRPEFTAAKMVDVLFTKSSDWKYEMEVRLVSSMQSLHAPDGSHKHFAPIDPTAVTDVFFGMSTVDRQPALERIARLLLEPRWQHVRISLLAPSKDEFALETVALDRKMIAEQLATTSA
jgi:hypothetical protein